jgi:hypothetical protein
MDSPERGALMLVRFLAVALIGWAVAETALYWAVCQHDHQPVETVKMIIKSLPSLGGIVILLKARALAEWISNLLDD